MTQKQIVDEIIDIKYLTQIIVTDNCYKYVITNTYHEVLHYKYATNIIWDKYWLSSILSDLHAILSDLHEWSYTCTISKKRSTYYIIFAKSFLKTCTYIIYTLYHTSIKNKGFYNHLTAIHTYFFYILYILCIIYILIYILEFCKNYFGHKYFCDTFQSSFKEDIETRKQT